MSQPQISILLPTYNGEAVVGETLRSILSQSFTDYEIIVVDDASTDETVLGIESLADPRIKIFTNPENLGYARNLEVCRQKATGEIIYLMGQDDILAAGILQKTIDAFGRSEDIGAVTRPYFWFDAAIDQPVRAQPQLNPEGDEIVRITDRLERVFAVFDSLGQLSGLALRAKYLDQPFHEDIFPCHAYPFVAIFKRYPVVFLKDYAVAVRIRSSQTRSVSKIYERSPLASWRRMFETILSEPEFEELRRRTVQDFLGRDYLGLIQLRNYARYRYLLREIGELIGCRWQNIFSPLFWLFSLGTMLMPPFLLIPLVDWYKKAVGSKRIPELDFNYRIL